MTKTEQPRLPECDGPPSGNSAAHLIRETYTRPDRPEKTTQRTNQRWAPTYAAGTCGRVLSPYVLPGKGQHPMPQISLSGPDRRNWQVAFALFCAVAAVLIGLRSDPPYPLVQRTGVAGYTLVALLTAGCAWALDRPRSAVSARKTLILLHLVFIPPQFFFLLAHKVPFAGMLLSTVIVARMKPRFPQLKRRARKVWLTLHVGISVGWLGLSLAMTTLAIAAATADDHVIRHGAYELMHVFDLAIVIPSALAAILSGLVVSLGTPWGLIRHWWVLLKFVIAVSLPVIATVESTWIEQLENRTQDPAAEPGGLGLTLVICMILFVVLLWTAVTLSIFKTGGRTRWGRAGQARRSAQAHPTENSAIETETVPGRPLR